MASNSYEFEKKYAEYKNKKKKKQEREEEKDKKAQTQESTSLDAFDVKYEAYKSGKDPGLEWQRRRAENYVKNQSEKDPSKSKSAQPSLSRGETQRGSRVGDTAVQVVPGKTVLEANKQVNATVRSASDIAKDLRAVDSQIEKLNVNTTRNTSWVPANVQTEEQKQKLNSLKTTRERLQQEYNAATRLPEASEVSVPQNYTRNMPVTMPEGMRRAEYWASIPDYTDLTANLSELETKKQELTDSLDRSTRDLRIERQKLLSQKGNSTEKQSRLAEIDAKLKEAEEKAGISAINQQIAEAQSLLPASYAKLQRATDFEENGVFDEGFANFSKDALYNLVNKPNEDNPLVTNFFDPQEGVKAGEGAKAFSDIVTGTVFNDPTFIRNMTDDERKTYNYIYKKSGKEAAEKYLSTIESGLTARYREQIEEQSQKFAKEHPVAASALTVAASPLKAVGYVGQVADYAASGKIDQNSPRNAAAYSSTAVRGEVAENIDESITRRVDEVWGNVGSNAYQIGMSMADFAFNTLASGGTAPLASFIMGSSAAADTTIRAKDRGLKDNQAFALGFISGATELLTEKYSIDTLLEKSGMGKKAFTYWLKNVIGEGSEETTSEFVNIVADIMIAGDKSEWNQSIETYKKNGMSEQDAFWATFADNAINLGVSFIGGAVSGGTLAALKLGGDVIDRKVTHSGGQVHREIYDADTANKTEKLSAVNAALETAKSARIDDPAEMTKTSAEFVRTVRDARPDTKNAINTAIDYVREEISVYNDLIKDTKDSKQKSEYIVERAALINVDKTLRSNRAEVDAILANLPASAPEPTKPRQTVTKPVLKGYGIDTEVSANEFHEYLLNQLQTGKITQEEADTLDAEYEAKYPKKAAETKLNAATAAYQKGEISEEQYDKQYSQYESELNDIDSRMSSETFPVRLRPIYEEVVQPVSEAETQTEQTVDDGTNAADTTSVNAGEGSAPVRENVADVAVDEAQTAEEVAERLAEEGYSFRDIRDQINAYRAENTAESNAAATRLEEADRILVKKNRANIQKVANAYAPALKRFGINGVVVEDMPVGQNAAFDRKTNTIHLSSRISDSGAVGRFIVHEFTHRGTKIDMSLADSIVSAMESRKGGRGYISEAVIRDAYADQLSGLSAEEADSIVREERAAHFMERIMEDVNVLDEFRDDRTFLRKILDAIRDFFARHNPDKQEQIQLQRIEKKINELLDKAGVDADVRGDKKTKSSADGVRYSYAGENANSADADSLNRAKEMEKSGEDSETIRKETGWFKGYDGKWRFEIDDSGMRVTVSEETPNYTTLREIIKHPKLFRAYPELQNVDVVFQNLNNANGVFSNQFWEINIDKKLKADPERLKRVLLHEIQHAIQHEEGFAHGASPEHWERRLKDGFDSRTESEKARLAEYQEKYDTIRREQPEFFEDMIRLREMEPTVPRGAIDWDTLEQIEEDPPEWQEYDAERERMEEKHGDMAVFDFVDLAYQLEQAEKTGGRSAVDLYYDTAGEIEARNNASRAGLDAEQRKNTRPDIDQTDVVFADDATFFSADISKKEIKSESKALLKILSDNIDKVSQEQKFSVSSDGIVDGSKIEFVENIFKTQGEKAVNPRIGDVNLTKKGAKSTIMHGYGKNKLISVPAIKDVIESGDIISTEENYKNSGVDRYVIAARGAINETDSFLVVVVEGYSLNDGHKQFYLHEVMIKETASPIMTATPEADTVSETVSDNSIAENADSVNTSGENIRSSRDLETPEQRHTRLMEENNEYLKKQFRAQTAFGWAKTVSPAQRNKFAGTIAADIPGVSAAEVSAAIKPVYDLFETPKRGSKDTPEVRFEETRKAAVEAAERLVDGAIQTEVNPLYEQYNDLRNFLRTTPIKRNASVEEFGGAEAYSKWRNGNKGLLRVSDDPSARTIDQVYKEISEQYPEFFPEDITDLSEMLRRMGDVAVMLKAEAGNKTVRVNPLEDVRDSFVQDVASRILFGFDELARITPAAKYEYSAKVNERDVQQAYAEGSRDAAAREAQAYESGVKEGRRQNDREVQAARQREDIQYQIFQRDFNQAVNNFNLEIERQNKRIDALQTRIEKRGQQEQLAMAKKVVYGRLNRLNTMLTKPTRSKHIPQNLRAPVAKLLETIGTTRLPNGKTVNAETMRDIQEKEYARFEAESVRAADELETIIGANPSSGDNAVTKQFLDKLQENVRRLKEMYADINPNSPDDAVLAPDLAATKQIEYVKQLNKILAMTENYIKDSDTVFLAGKAVSAKEFSERMISDLRGKTVPNETNHLRKFIHDVGYEFVSADLFFEMIGETGDEIMRQYRKAQTTQAKCEEEYAQYVLEKTGGKYSTNKAGYNGEKIDITVDGKNIKATRAQLMQLYMTWKRPAGRRHLRSGGAIFVNEAGVELSENTVLINDKTYNELISRLTEEDKRIADALGSFMIRRCAEWGNDASMKMYGYRMFEDPNYFPMDVSNNVLPANWDSMDEFYRLENAGMTKSIKENASAPLRMTDIFDVADFHVRTMAAYTAYAPVSNDVQRILSMPGVNEAVNVGMEKKGAKYLETLVKTIASNKVRTGDMSDAARPLQFFMNAYKRQAVSFNISTALKQPLSIIRALNEIDAKYIAKVPLNISGSDYKRAYNAMIENSGVAKMKMLGYSDTGFGKSLRQIYDEGYINESGVIRGSFSKTKAGRVYVKVYDKITDAGMWAAGKMDEMTWVRLWRACELEVADRYKGLSAKEKTAKVAERFNEIIGRSQVVDTVLDTSPLMRNNAMALLTPFMNEPTKALATMITAADAWRDGKPNGKKKLAKAIGLVALNNLLLEPIVSSLMTMWRDEEDDTENIADFSKKFLKLYAGVDLDEGTSITSVFTSNAVSGVLGGIPIIQIFYNAFADELLGFSSEKIDTAALSNLIRDTKNLIVNIQKAPVDRVETNYKLFGDFLGSAAAAIGIPLPTLRRQVSAMGRTILEHTDNYEAQWDYARFLYNLENGSARTQKQFYNIMAAAYKAGDVEAYRYMLNDLKNTQTGKKTIGVSWNKMKKYIEDRGGEYEIGSDLWLVSIQAEFNLPSFNPSMKVESSIAKIYKNALAEKVKNPGRALPSTPALYSYNKVDEDGNDVLDENGDPVKVEMTLAEYEDFIADVGRLSYNILLALQGQGQFKNLSAEEQVYCLDKAYDFAARYYRSKFNPDYNLSSGGKWMAEVAKGNLDTTKISRAILKAERNRD